MSDYGETSQRLSVPEAAAYLGLSVATVRRMIRDGRLKADTVRRPQGVAYVVVLPSEHADRAERSSTAQQVGTTARLTSSEAGTQETALAAWVVSLMAPLADANQRQHETIERQAGEVAELRERVGRQGAELEAERRARQQFVSERDAAELSRRRDRRRLAIALAVAVLVAVVLVAGMLAMAGWVR